MVRPRENQLSGNTRGLFQLRTARTGSCFLQQIGRILDARFFQLFGVSFANAFDINHFVGRHFQISL